MCVVSGVGAAHGVPATQTQTLRPTRYLYSARVGGNQLTPACHIICHKYLMVVLWWISSTMYMDGIRSGIFQISALNLEDHLLLITEVF